MEVDRNALLDGIKADLADLDITLLSRIAEAAHIMARVQSHPPGLVCKNPGLPVDQAADSERHA